MRSGGRVSNIRRRAHFRANRGYYASANEAIGEGVKRRLRPHVAILEGDFVAPQFSVQRASNLRRDLGSRNRISRNKTDGDLAGELYLDANTTRSVDIPECLCRDVQKHVWFYIRISWKRAPSGAFKTLYDIRQMGRWAMRRSISLD